MTITLTRKEAQQVLDALELHWATPPIHVREVIQTLKTRLSQCERCGEINPAEIHTCTPKSEEGCAECGKKSSDGWALYCVKCSEREWQGLTENEKELLWDEAVEGREHFCSQYGNFADAIEAKLKQKNA
jgi:hypothetical protein